MNTKIIIAILVVSFVSAVGASLWLNQALSPVISLNPSPSPVFTPSGDTLVFDGFGGGCGNIFVYRMNSDLTRGISVRADKDALGLSETEKTFTVGSTSGLTVELIRAAYVKSLYCNDAINPNQPVSERLISGKGTATISISGFNASSPVWARSYSATVILRNIEFTDRDGTVVYHIDELILRDVSVGQMPG